jgi:hypothetical protein
MVGTRGFTGEKRYLATFVFIGIKKNTFLCLVYTYFSYVTFSPKYFSWSWTYIRDIHFKGLYMICEYKFPLQKATHVPFWIQCIVDGCDEWVGTASPLSHDSGWQPKIYVKPEAAITVFELLMIGGVSPETCWAIKKKTYTFHL